LPALPHPLVEPPGAAEMLVAASLSDPAVVELHDLADLVEPTRWWVMSRTDRPSGGLRQIRGDRLTRLWVRWAAGSSRFRSAGRVSKARPGAGCPRSACAAVALCPRPPRVARPPPRP